MTDDQVGGLMLIALGMMILIWRKKRQNSQARTEMVYFEIDRTDRGPVPSQSAGVRQEPGDRGGDLRVYLGDEALISARRAPLNLRLE
jgi:hypothetical protein